MIQTREEYSLRPIGHIRSTLRALGEAPRQGSEGAPDAWLEVDPTFARGLSGVAAGDEVIVVTWFHRADRDVLETHPRNDPEIPLAGVFATRSPDRPNPLGLHRVTVREISGTRLRIGPIEAIDGTPVVASSRSLSPAPMPSCRVSWPAPSFRRPCHPRWAPRSWWCRRAPACRASGRRVPRAGRGRAAGASPG
jgi:tRNA-Thr(GGU) m(6)t(6)A37 methyltransferase TsaA